jgi:Domain of unknown function DUF11
MRKTLTILPALALSGLLLFTGLAASLRPADAQLADALPPRPTVVPLATSTPTVQPPGEPSPAVPAIELQSDRSQAAPGNLINLTLVVSNPGERNARGVEARLPLNPALELLSVRADPPAALWLNPQNATYKLAIGSLAPGSTVKLQAVMRVKPGATTGEKLYVWGTVAYKTGPDTTATHTSDYVTIQVANP